MRDNSSFPRSRIGTILESAPILAGTSTSSQIIEQWSVNIEYLKTYIAQTEVSDLEQICDESGNNIAHHLVLMWLTSEKKADKDEYLRLAWALFIRRTENWIQRNHKGEQPLQLLPDQSFPVAQKFVALMQLFEKRKVTEEQCRKLCESYPPCLFAVEIVDHRSLLIEQAWVIPWAEANWGYDKVRDYMRTCKQHDTSLSFGEHPLSVFLKFLSWGYRRTYLEYSETASAGPGLDNLKKFK